MRSIVVTSYNQPVILSLHQRWRFWMNDTPKATYSEFFPAVSQLRPSFSLTIQVSEGALEAIRGRLSMILSSIDGGSECDVQEFEIEV